MDNPWWKIVVALTVVMLLAGFAIRALKASVMNAPADPPKPVEDEGKGGGKQV